VALLLAGVLATVYLQDPLYARRVLTFRPGQLVTAVDWYQPQEVVRGTHRDDLRVAREAERTIPAAALEAARRYADATASIALLVWRDGAIQYEHYWPGYGPETRTDPASMHKTVLALVTGAAVADGLIPSVDAPASRWLQEWRNDARAGIRVRDLLQMQSGLDLVPFSPNPFGTYFKSLLGTDIDAIALGLRPVAPPGTRFEYSSMNSQALGLLVERAAGRRYAEYLSERLWSRLGAGDAYLWLDRPGGAPHRYCCLQTTARGWLRVGLLLLEQGRVGDDQVVPADWIRAMTMPAAHNPNFGYQVWLGSPSGGVRRYNSRSVAVARHSAPYLAADVIFSDGFGGQRVYVVPSQRLVIVRTGEARADWDDARLPNAILAGLQELPPAAPMIN
jgi:CubicO group peptidase (beta-lactamase class C family)